MEQPIRTEPKIVKWGIKAGFTKTFQDGHQEMMIQAYQKRPTRTGNSGPVGKRARRFYQMRAVRKNLGKGWWKKTHPGWEKHIKRVPRFDFSKVVYSGGNK